jgi:RimJ/RimL family protein N-acetyltransferase
MPSISLNILVKEHAATLTDILNHDQLLAVANNGTLSHIQPTAFIEQCAEWMRRKHGQTYAILHDGRPIGTISLSSGGLPKRHGRVGYWLASDYWNRGYGTAAFHELMKVAQSEGFKQIETIFAAEASPASIAIWKKKGATFLEHPDGQRAVINL